MDVTVSDPPVGRRGPSPQTTLLGFVGAAVGINLMAALVMKWAAIRGDLLSATTVLVIGLVLVLNGVRFLMWRAAHRRYRFADVMPLSALFFPLVGFTSWLQGEPMNWYSVLGIGLITAGAATLVRRAEHDVR